MSILLDALKKSEERRQRGSAPRIHSPAASPVAKGLGARQWGLLALLAVVIMLAAWFGWRQYRAPDSAPGASSAAAPQPTAAAVAGQAEAVVAAAAEQSEAGGGPRTPVETFAPDSESAQGGGAKSASASMPADLEKTKVNQAFTDFEAAPQPSSAAQQAPLETTSSGAAEAAAPPAVDKPSRAARPPAAANEPITFWELPQGIRDSLPDLRITVLVFAERPKDRFVLIAGQRRVETDRLQEGLVLEEIRRDGAVFTYRNYRFLVEG